MKKTSAILAMMILSIEITGFEISAHEYILNQAYQLFVMQCPSITQTDFVNHIYATNYYVPALNTHTADWAPKAGQYPSQVSIGIGTALEDISNPMLGDMEATVFYSSHFWDSSQGDGSSGLAGTSPNAMQKAHQYLTFNGKWISFDQTFDTSDPAHYFDRISNLHFYHYGLLLKMTGQDIFNFWNNGQILLMGYYNRQMDGIFPFGGEHDGITIFPTEAYPAYPEYYLTENERKRIVYQMVGRITHLLQDCCVPAHAHMRPHACGYLQQGDYFEKWTATQQGTPLSNLDCDPVATTMNIEMWDAETAYEQGGLINVNEAPDPVRALMYICNQVALHFPTESFESNSHVAGSDNLFTGSNNGSVVYGGFDYTLIKDIPEMLNPSPVGINNEQDLIDQGDAIVNVAIRATAGWLAYVAKQLGYLEDYQLEQGVYLANMWEEENIGGTLSIDSKNEIIQSGGVQYVPLGSNQTCRVEQFVFPESGLIQKNWNRNDQNFQVQNTFICEPLERQIAHYDIPGNVNFGEPVGSIQMKDPWMVENPQADPQDWIQPNTFHTMGASSYPVFLNQNPTFEENIPIYSLRAPLHVYMDGNNIMAFKAWRAYEPDGVTPDLNGDYAVFEDSTDYNECGVVFKSEGAVIRASYEPANARPNYSLRIKPNDDLTIPSGSVIQCADGFAIEVDSGGALTIEAGTAEHPTILKSSNPDPGPASWRGIFYHADGPYYSPAQTNFENIEIWNAEVGFSFSPNYFSNSAQAIFSNITLNNCAMAFSLNEVNNVELSNIIMRDCIVGVWNLDEYPDPSPSPIGFTVISNSIFDNVEVPVVLLNRDNCGLMISDNNFLNYQGYGVYLSGYTSHNDQNVHGINISGNVFESGDNIAAITAIGRGPITVDHNLIDLSNTRGTGICVSNCFNSDNGWGGLYSNIEIQEGYFPAEYESDYGINLSLLYNRPTYPYNDPPQYYSGDYSIINNTIVGGYRGMLLDIETSATTWYSKIQNNILLNPNNDSENPDNLAVDQLYCSGSGIVSAYGITNPDYNDIGYNLFFGQAGQGTDYKAYLVNNSGWVFEPMSPFGTDLYNVDPLLTPNNHPQSELSPPVDRGNPNLDNDGEDWHTDTDDQDPDKSRMDIGAFYHPKLAGTVEQDFILNGSATIGNENGDDVIIPAAYSLSVEPGTEVLVRPNTRLLVNGSLYIQGTQDNPVSFTTETGVTWRGIEVASGHIEADHTLIENASGAGLGLSSGTTGWVRNSEFANSAAGLRLHLIDTDLQVDGNDFHDNIVGLNVRTSQPKIINNHVHHNSVIGIALLSGSNSYLGNNEIDHNGNGDYHAGGICMMASSPVLSTGFKYAFALPFPTNNKIHDNVGNGIYSSYTGIPNLGIYDTDSQSPWTYGGFNHFYQNTGVAVYRNGSGVPVWADPPSPLSQSALYGQVNYWYSNLMEVTAPGTDQVSGSLNWNPTAGMLIAGDEGNYDEFELLQNGLKSEQLADYQTAIDYYQQFLDTKPKFELAIVAMSGQDRCYSQLKAIDQWQVELEEISQNFDDEQQKELAKNYLIWVYKKQQMDQEAIAMAEQLIDASAGTEYADYYALEIAMLADETDGAILAKSLPAQKGVAARIQTAQKHLLAADNFSDAARFYKLMSGGSASQPMNRSLPQSYALHPAYPNPFNPITTIRYDLPEAGRVRLMVYDIRGRVVTTLTDEPKQPGSYRVQWQGKDASGRMVGSGLYFYTLEAVAAGSNQTFRSSRKMLLMK